MLPGLTNIGLVALGGAFGAVGRYISMSIVGRLLGLGFPYSTLFVNIFGSLLMGVLIEILSRYMTESSNIHLLLAVGFLGGFTTFSAFSLDVVTLFERGELISASIYIVASVILSVGGLFAGLALTRFFLS